MISFIVLIVVLIIIRQEVIQTCHNPSNLLPVLIEKQSKINLKLLHFRDINDTCMDFSYFLRILTANYANCALRIANISIVPLLKCHKVKDFTDHFQRKICIVIIK